MFNYSMMLWYCATMGYRDTTKVMLKFRFFCFSSEGERHPQAVEEHGASPEEGNADRVSTRRFQVGASPSRDPGPRLLTGQRFSRLCSTSVYTPGMFFMDPQGGMWESSGWFWEQSKQIINIEAITSCLQVLHEDISKWNNASESLWLDSYDDQYW